MTHLRGSICGGVLALALSACSSTIDGDPAYVAPTSSGTDDVPSSSPSVNPDQMCTLIPRAELEQIFGAPVETSDHGLPGVAGCAYQGGSLSVAVGHLPVSTLREIIAGNKPTEFSIGGHTAYRLIGGDVAVATGPDPDSHGVLKAYTQDTPELQDAAIGLLTALLGYYEY